MEEEERKFIRDFDRFHDDFWQKMTGGKGTAFYVAENPAGKVVGMVWLRVSERISGLKWGWIHDLTVDEGFRRKGIGRMLLERATEHFREHGIHMIGLMALVDNQPARKLYEKAGFVDRSIYMVKTIR